MKIEMGESLFYSWLRHVKECQVVQTNWKPSPSWSLYDEEWLGSFMKMSSERFSQKFGLLKANLRFGFSTACANFGVSRPRSLLQQAAED